MVSDRRRPPPFLRPAVDAVAPGVLDQLRDLAAAAAGPRPTRVLLNGVPISENRKLPRGTVYKLLDPVELVVWDVAWFRARVEMVQEVRDIFDRLRVDLRLPVPDRAAGRIPTPTRMQQ